jgi:hypothetical protein
MKAVLKCFFIQRLSHQVADFNPCRSSRKFIRRNIDQPVGWIGKDPDAIGLPVYLTY